MQAQTPRKNYEVVGIVQIAGVDSLGGASVALMTMPEAQRVTGKVGKFDSISVGAAPGVDPKQLSERIEEELAHTLRSLDLLVPYADGGSLAELHELAGEVSREDTAEGVRVRALVPARLAERFARFAVAS